MKSIDLTETTQFCIEPLDNQVRLVVMKNGAEWVCRKESYQKLDRFLKADTGRLFKGRLQLVHADTNLGIEVKGAEVGTVSVDHFRQYLSELKAFRNGSDCIRSISPF
ncbi:hypothetical protein [Larkinella sp. C7]|jgi:hypothetical protein|uniref:hypothetical protein n=1 Tax=Larkinella sp. C7 TaxID=2576607 RepID=UPI0011114AC6|nr:hypothetical protein [Larkinella sp. C7]